MTCLMSHTANDRAIIEVTPRAMQLVLTFQKSGVSNSGLHFNTIGLISQVFYSC